MLYWGIITLITPVAAFFTWYSKGEGIFSILCSAIILSIFFDQAFSFGIWYINVSYYTELIILFLSIALLYRDKKQISFSLIGALVIAPFVQFCSSFIFGEL